MEDITVLIIEPGKEPYVKAISSDLKSLQQEVGGYIQTIYPWEDLVAVICNDEGKLNGLALNRALRDEDGHIYDVIAGTFIIAGLSDDNFASLSSKEVEKFSKLFELPEIFIKTDNDVIVVQIIE